MTYKLKNLSFIFLALCLIQCKQEPKQLDNETAFESFTKITGSWQLQPNLTTYEMWEPMKNGLIGKGYTIDGTDTTINEVYFFEHIGDSLRLEVQPINDNGISQPISYYLTSASPKTFVFENQEHNFPKKMTYKFQNDEISIILEGEIGGLHQQADLILKRVSQ